MKSLISIMLCIALAGCAGYTSSEPILDPVTHQPKMILGMYPMSKKVKKSEPIALLDSLAPIVANVKYQPVIACDSTDISSIATLTERGQEGYYRAVEQCEQHRGMAKMMAYALGVSTDPVEAIAKYFSESIKSIQTGKSKRVNAVVNTLSTFGLGTVAGNVLKAGFNTAKTIGVEAARTGNITTVEGISISSSQRSNGVSQAAGEGSMGGAVDAGNSRGTEATTIIIGTGNNAGTAFDNGVAQVDTRSTQQLAESANGSITDGSKTNGNQVADDLAGDNTSNDEDGIKL